MAKSHQKPPRLAEAFLEWFCDPAVLETLQGDLQELYARRVEEMGKRRARLYFTLDVLDSCRPFAWKRKRFFQTNHPDMFQNNLKVAWRNMLKHKFFSVVNISGLSLGLTFSLLILLWVRDEMSYDRFHQDSDRIYQSFFHTPNENGVIRTTGNSPYPLYRAYRDEIPGVEESAVFQRANERILKVGEKQFKSSGAMGSYSLFRIFSFPLVDGVLPDGVADPATLMISESLAHRLFGTGWKGNVIGQTINVNNQNDLTVVGVFADIPRHSTLRFDYLINIELNAKSQPWTERWGNWLFSVYIKAMPQADLSQVAANALALYRDSEAYEKGEQVTLFRFADRYLHGKYVAGKPAGGRIEYVRTFFLAGLFLLIIACINFINLSTARAARRAREVGVRKVVGANRLGLIHQFLTEAGLITIISVVLAVLLAWLILPEVNEFTGKNLLLDFTEPTFWLVLIGISVLTTALSGSYPAFVLSGFRISRVLKGQLTPEIKNVHFRKGLVVLQFVLSTLLIFGTITIQKQIHFLQNKNLGLDRENIVYLNMTQPVMEKFGSFKEELLRQPGISKVVRTSHVPVNVRSATGDLEWEGKASDNHQMFKLLFTDHEDFASMFGIEMVQGRFFREDMKTDSNGLVINEATARAMGIDNPVGTEVNFWGHDARVIGVVKDFHINSLYEDIQPLVIAKLPENTWSMFLQTEAGKTKEALAGLEKVHKGLFPAIPLEYTFLDDQYARMYQSEIQMGQLANYFALIAIFISCLGLLGLITFTIEEKTKEIGIRKVLGASVSNIVNLLSRDFLSLLVLALVIALPVSWYFANQWLEKFAFQINVDWWIFTQAGLIAILLALATVCLRALRAANANPIDSLRSE